MKLIVRRTDHDMIEVLDPEEVGVSFVAPLDEEPFASVIGSDQSRQIGFRFTDSPDRDSATIETWPIHEVDLDFDQAAFSARLCPLPRRVYLASINEPAVSRLPCECPCHRSKKGTATWKRHTPLCSSTCDGTEEVLSAREYRRRQMASSRDVS